MKPTLVLIDGSSYFYRAFHALPPLTNSKGLPTGAIYGVANMIKKLIREESPSHIAVVFDAKGKTFRDDWFPNYKATRPPTPTDLSVQFEPLLELLNCMGLPLLVIDGVEADDVIGTLAKQAELEGAEVLISTGDKDMAQLVTENITLINTMTDSRMDPEGVKLKFGVRPEQIIEYLTLVGDTSDNIPGVVKCGPKTAVKWLSEYGTLENLVVNASSVGGKIGENLRDFLTQLPLSQKLVTIKTDVTLDKSWQQLTQNLVNAELLLEKVKDLEFKSWIKELQSSSIVTNQPNRESEINTDTHTVSMKKYVTITDKSELIALIEQLKAAPYFAIDTETTDLEARRANLVGISFAHKADEAYYIPVGHEAGAQLDKSWVLEQLKPLLEDDNKRKIGQNLKYDIQIFKNEGINLLGILNDTMLASYVLNSNANRHDLETLSLKFLGHTAIPFEAVAGKGVKQVTFDKVDIEAATQYASEDADLTLQLHETLYPKLTPSLQKVLEHIDLPLVPVLAQMEYNGVLIYTDVLAKQGERLKSLIQSFEDKAYKIAGRTFNMNSPLQLQALLFDELKLPIIAKTPKGQPSTAEAVLQELAHDYELPSVILSYRSLTKLVSTYIDALPKKVNPTTGRVHASFNQAVAATGRLSSSDPNLQNIPIRTDEGRLIRQSFVARPGYQILALDYSQIELRIMAHLSQDPGLLKAFAEGIDIHKATASEIFQVPLSDVTDLQRRHAKAVNFGLIYGMSAFGLSKQIHVSREEADSYMVAYFKRYPNVQGYMERTRKFAHDNGYVETLFGRRLYLAEINDRNMARQKASERAAINAPMQGTAADLIKKAMLAIYQWLNETKIDCQMILQVHDELVFEVEQSVIPMTIAHIKQLMEKTTLLDVPLEVSVGIGQNWDEAH